MQRRLNVFPLLRTEVMSKLVSHSKSKLGQNHLLVQYTPKAICQSTEEKKCTCQSGIKRIISPHVSWQSYLKITFRVAVQKLYEITHDSVCADNDLLLHSAAPIWGQHSCIIHLHWFLSCESFSVTPTTCLSALMASIRLAFLCSSHPANIFLVIYPVSLSHTYPNQSNSLLPVLLCP